ncbi:alpha/beta hydrolase [Paenibacillus sp. NEAU-GSW1]|uniref:alpha/beta hydrolase n=1 Tax=Paenibacillus sp. NEAU-GSW1 TaxID=2682486 RepID=UPI0012E20696|nr:alpha/beta fold hydrolase [Paenibacillus sp. NEAU-GSW1]MUT67954.1 alpha/beta fold hydrolase [Paenibacillus sp. NEAU-GSW1]
MKLNLQQKSTVLWLTGWSMPDSVFDRLRELLPEFHHVSLVYSTASSAEEMMRLTETAAREARSAASGPLLIGGWSLGGLLALRLAIQGLADGLVLFAATAKFTRPKGQTNLGWADAYVRQMIIGIGKDRQAVEQRFRQLVFSETETDGEIEFPRSGTWNASALIAGLEILRSVDFLPRLSEIDCPVFLAHGADDQIIPYAAAEELLLHLPQAKLLAVPECGHAPFRGREADVAESLRSWWNGG